MSQPQREIVDITEGSLLPQFAPMFNPESLEHQNKIETNKISNDEWYNRNRSKRQCMHFESDKEKAEFIAETTGIDTNMLRTVLIQVVHEVKRMTAHMNELRSEITDLRLEVAELRCDKRNLPPQHEATTNPFSLATGNQKAQPNEKKPTNYRASTPKQTYSSVVAKNLVGNRADTIEVMKPQQQKSQSSQTADLPHKATQEVLQRLTFLK